MTALVSMAGRGSRIERERQLISRSLHRLGAPGSQFRLLRATDPGRSEVEQFIAQRFQAVHGARVTSFLPLLLGAWSGGACRTALGIRAAAAEALFLEHYLDQPAEQTIAAICRAPVSRATVVEIGNLVSAPGMSTLSLYLLLLAVLDRAGYRWLMFTATPDVRYGIQTLGFELLTVCAADPRRVADSDSWGSYYDNGPEVMLGDVEDGMRRCKADVRLRAALLDAEAVVAELAAKLGAP